MAQPRDPRDGDADPDPVVLVQERVAELDAHARARGAERADEQRDAGTRHQLDRGGSRKPGRRSAAASGKRAPDRRAAIPRYLAETYEAISAELVSDEVPAALARGVCQQAASMAVTEVVQALEKCQAMALRLKAAKFLKGNAKDDIQALRAYAERLVMGETEQ